MKFHFFVDPQPGFVPEPDATVITLSHTSWDDYGFGTTYSLQVWSGGAYKYLGVTKIGRKGMTSQGAFGPTHHTEIERAFFKLSDENYFSVGQDSSYYSNLVQEFGVVDAKELLKALCDLAAMPALIDAAITEEVAQRSLFRSVTVRTVQDQYARILQGDDRKQEFTLRYAMDPNQLSMSPTMTFTVNPELPLPSNVHVIIGANGTGKTTALRQIRWAFDDSDEVLHNPSRVSVSDRSRITGLVSVSFSAFEVFPEPRRDALEQANFRVTNVGRDWLVGVTKSAAEEEETEEATEVEWQRDRYRELIEGCLEDRSDRLLRAFGILADADLILERHQVAHIDSIRSLDFPSLSSGHKIVLLTLASLVRFCEEKTLVLLDEPESHLHPPLLGAFTRAVSWLMSDTNGLAIIATHSPVVLQEVPRRCAWRVWNVGGISGIEQPEIETFGENLGVLTREIFGLELAKSGYHTLLRGIADASSSYEEAVGKLQGEIGEEAKLLLRSMIRRNSAAK